MVDPSRGDEHNAAYNWSTFYAALMPDVCAIRSPEKTTALMRDLLEVADRYLGNKKMPTSRVKSSTWTVKH